VLGALVPGAQVPVRGCWVLVPGAGCWCRVQGAPGTSIAQSPRMVARRFEELDAWQLANELKRKVYELVATTAAKSDLGLSGISCVERVDGVGSDLRSFLKR
jgi:hypothetical protein